MKGDFILWNRAAEETLGYEAEEVIRKMNIQQVYPEGMAKQVMKMMRAPEYGGPRQAAVLPQGLVHVRRDGDMVEGNVSAAIIYDSRGSDAAQVSTVDLKDRLEMEAKLEMPGAAPFSQEKSAAMKGLPRRSAHELNNPLTGSVNTLELLKTEVPPGEQEEKDP